MASAFEKAVSILLAHYQSDYDTTVPGKEFDAEVRRIVAAYTSQIRDAALEEAAKVARHFKDELTAEEWPPSGLCQSDGRFDGAVGEHAATWIEQKILALKEQK